MCHIWTCADHIWISLFTRYIDISAFQNWHSQSGSAAGSCLDNSRAISPLRPRVPRYSPLVILLFSRMLKRSSNPEMTVAEPTQSIIVLLSATQIVLPCLPLPSTNIYSLYTDSDFEIFSRMYRCAVFQRAPEEIAPCTCVTRVFTRVLSDE